MKPDYHETGLARVLRIPAGPAAVVQPASREAAQDELVLSDR